MAQFRQSLNRLFEVTITITFNTFEMDAVNTLQAIFVSLSGRGLQVDGISGAGYVTPSSSSQDYHNVARFEE